MIDETHDRARQSWVASANGHAEFPLQNLPFGVFSPPGDGAGRQPARRRRDRRHDLRPARRARCRAVLGRGRERAAAAASGATLNPLMALGAGAAPRVAPAGLRAARRRRPGRAKAEPLADRLLHRAADCWLHLPAAIGNFTDFFAGIHHATNGGRAARPEQSADPELQIRPGRLSQPGLVGARIERPGAPAERPAQSCRTRMRRATARAASSITNSNWRCGSGPATAQGEPIPIGAGRRAHFRPRARQRLVGARHPALGDRRRSGRSSARTSARTVSPWIVTAEALEPFRVAQPPRPGRRSAPAALSVGRPGPAERAPSTSRSKR